MTITRLVPAVAIACLLVGCTSKQYSLDIENGNKHLAQKDYQSAISDFKDALALSPNDSTASEGLKKAQHGLLVEEMKKYAGSMNPLTDQAAQLGQEWTNLISGAQSGQINELAFMTEMNTSLIPKTRNLVDQSTLLDVPDQVSNIHKLFTQACLDQLNGMLEMMAAVSANDASKVAEANNLLYKSTDEVKEYVKQLGTFLKSNNIQPQDIGLPDALSQS